MEQLCVVLHVVEVKCSTDHTLEKTRLTSVTEDDKNSLTALRTMTSTCSLHGEDARFEDGLTTEKIKCTDVLSSGRLSHEEYSCAGIIRRGVLEK